MIVPTKNMGSLFDMKSLSALIATTCLMIHCTGYCDEIKTVLLNTEQTFQHQVEVFIQKPDGKQFPLIIVLHGASKEIGIRNISKDWVDVWLEKGYAVAGISMPGFGQTTGRKDFCGPHTLQSLHFAIDAIKEELGVSDFGIIGFGQGATAGILLATQRKDVRCVLSSNGAYDLLSHCQKEDRLTEALIAKNYAITINEADLKIRSPIEYVRDIKSSLFILHREGNPIIPEVEVIRFCDAMRQAEKDCKVSILPKGPGKHEQMPSYAEIMQEAEGWIDAHMDPHATKF